MQNKILKFCLLIALVMTHAHKDDSFVVSGPWLERKVSYQKERVPAQALATSPVCKSELFSVEELKREAAHYEAMLEGGAPLSGSWEHLELKDLPLAQARFFRALGSNWGDLNNPGSIDVSACQDVPCVVNTVYGSTTGIEGWSTYVWWLKMGNILTFKNRVYKQASPFGGKYNGNAYTLKDYLFTENEHYAFWRLTHLLPTRFKSITNLKAFHRLPKNENFEGYQPDVCGLASGDGHIMLKHTCLSLGDFDPAFSKDRGTFYHLVVHEMAHILDNLLSGVPERFLYFSHQAAWRTQGLWNEVEAVDPVTKAVTRSWVSTLPKENFVTPYAQTTPVEHFAETTAFYRYNGPLSKSALPPATYDFMKDHIYEKAEFTDAGMAAYLRQQAERQLSPQVFSATMDCYQGTGDYPAGPALSISELPSALDDGKRRCLHQQRETLARAALADVRLNSADACSYFRKPERVTEFTQEVHRWIGQQFSTHILKALSDENYFEQLAAFYKEVASGLAPVQMMTQCYGEPLEKECYRTKVSEFLVLLVPDGQPNAERFRADLKEHFLENFPFETVRVETLKTYQDFISTQAELLSAGAGELWASCKNEAYSNTPAPRAGAFSVGTRWMVSSQFNCLNQGVVLGLDDSIERMEYNGEEISNDQEKKILRDLGLAAFLAELQRLYDADREAERLAILAARGTQQALKEYILSDFDWVQAFETNMVRQCLSKALAVLPGEPRYHSSDELKTFVAPTCEAVRTSPELQNYLKAHPELNEDFHVQAYVREVERLSLERSRVCEERHPPKGFLGKIRIRGRRSDCFNEGWEATNRTLLERAKREYNLNLKPAALERMRVRARDIRKRIKGDLLGDLF